MDSDNAETFNRSCIGVTLDRRPLIATLDRDVGVPALGQKLIVPHPPPFSNVPGLVPSSALAAMLAIASAIEVATRCSQTNLNLVHGDDDCPTAQLNASTGNIKP